MKSQIVYSIPLSGLKGGVHEFQMDIDNTFFLNYPFGVLQEGELQAGILLDKRPDFYVLKVHLTGWVTCECDRCLEDYHQAIEGSHQVILKYQGDPDGANEEDHDIIFINPQDTSYNISQLLYEYINLDLPMQKTHPFNEEGEFTCTNDIAKILKDQKNAENETPTDPRWDKLKDLN